MFRMCFRQNHSCSTSDSTYSYTVLCSMVRLSVCHTHAFCLNRSTDLDAIRQVHLWRPITHCVRLCPCPPPQETGGLQIAAKPSVLRCYLTNRNEELGGLGIAIQPFARLLWFLFYFLLNCSSDDNVFKLTRVYFELWQTAPEGKRSSGLTAVWLARNRFAVLDRTHSVPTRCSHFYSVIILCIRE